MSSQLQMNPSGALFFDLLRRIAALPLRLPHDPEGWIERLGARPPLAVVITVYNGRTFLEACLASVRENTPVDVQLVLVDDKSPDPEIAPYLARFASERENTVVVSHEQNTGYVTAVNDGILATEPHRDIVLLNSDTIVGAGWLERLQRTALSLANVGSVSPLSNAAGVYSVPTAHEDTPLPKGMSPELAQRALAFASPRLWEEVPVSCGFCMYLRRSTLETIGLFDSQLFYRGYGEENDWCARASREGFVHLIDDACFVYHQHGGSFGSEKRRLKQRNARVLRALHPTHVADTEKWQETTQLEAVRASYRELTQALGSASKEERRLLSKSPRTRLVLGGAMEQQGEYADRERTLVLQARADTLEVDVFGLTRVRIDDADLVAAVIALVNRWDVEVLELRAQGEVAERLAKVGAAFGIEVTQL